MQILKEEENLELILFLQEMGYSLRKGPNGPTLSEKQTLSYAYRVEECEIPFWTSAPTVL